MAFLPEDGNGLDGANALITVEYADAYHTERGNTAWSGSTTEKQQAIVRATDYVETRFGSRFSGSLLSPTQALSFPRQYLYDAEGNEITGVPEKVKKAVAEYALRALTIALMPDPTVDGSGFAVRSKKEVVGPIEESTDYFEGSRKLFRAYPAADKLLMPFMNVYGGVVRA